MSNYPEIWTNFFEDHFDKNDVNEMDSTTKSDIELPPRNLSQRWRRYGHDAKRRVFDRFSKWCPKGTATSNLFIYLKTDQTFPEFVLKSVIGFFGGIVLTYLCFVFFVFQLSISLIHATIMSSIIGVLLTFGLAFSYRIRCLVFLLIPQLFSRVGRYTLTCYALILILTGPATNTLKNSEVLTESMACTQEQIKTDVKQITDSVKKPFTSMRDAIKILIKRLNEIAYKMDVILEKINRLVTTIVDVLQSSYVWLYTVIEKCNEKFGTPYEHCIKVLTNEGSKVKEICKRQRKIDPNISLIANNICYDVNFNSKVCVAPDYVEESIAATIKRKLRTFISRVKAMFLIKLQMHHSYTFTSNSSRSPSQVTAGIVTEIRNRADPLLTWLSWSSCITSLFLLLIIFRAKYYQHMFETRSRFDNKYITKELRDLDLKRLQEGKETVLPLNRRERAKYVTTTSFRLVATEKVHLTRSMVFMTITTFKLMIHMIADYSLYWVLTTICYHGKRQTHLPPGPMDAGLVITGTGIIADIIRSIFKALIAPILDSPSPTSCLPNPYPPDLKRYTQIGVLIFLLWFFALFEPYGLRLRHLIMGHYRPERAKARAAWLYNHILRTRGSFMKFARRKLHKEFKYLPQENLTFRHWLRTRIPCGWLRCILGIAPLEPKCLLCNAKEVKNIPSSELIRCETQNCPGTFCISCFSDIGRLCTICLSPVDYGDFSDISLEKGSSEDSEDSSSQTNITNLLPKRKYFTKSRNSHGSAERDNLIGHVKKSSSIKPRYHSSKQSNEYNEKTSLLYSPVEEVEKYSIYNKYLTTNTFDFTHFSVPKNNLTVGFVCHNYICENNLVNKSSNMFKKHDNMNKDFIDNPQHKLNVHYGTMEKTLNLKRQLKDTEMATFKPPKLLQSTKPTSPKQQNISGTRCQNNSAINNSAAKVHTKAEKNKKPFRKNFKSPAYPNTGLLKSNHKHNNDDQRNNEEPIYYVIKKNMDKTLCYIKSSMIGISDRLENGKIKFSVYDIKKSTSSISISKISLNRKVRYRRKGTRGKTNGLTKGKQCTNNGSNTHLQENKPVIRHNLPLKTGNEDNENNELNICGDNNETFRVTSKKKHSKNFLSVRKIRKLFSNVMVMKYTLKGICYSKRKSKIDSLRFLKNKQNYKRRKKYLYHKLNKDSVSNKARNIRNDIEMTRNYRIYSYLNEGDWLKGKYEDISEYKQDNREITVNNVGDYYAGLKNYVQKITKKCLNSTTSSSNKHSSHTCNCDKIIDSINELDLKMENKNDYEASKISNCHTHLPVLSKSDSRGQIKNIVEHLKLSTSMKSFSLKNVKLYIANKFLHLKFGNPISVLRTYLSTVSLAKGKVTTQEIDVQNNGNTVDKEVAVSPIRKSCSCQCEIINGTIQQSDVCALPNKSKHANVNKDDKETQTEKKNCCCATQCSIDDMENNNYDSFIHDLYKGNNNYEALKQNIKTFTSDSTRTDTTLCSCVTVDFIDEIRKVKNKRATKRVNVITKSNQSTATDRTNLCNASTVTSDWWSPIVERKEMDYKNGDHVCNKRKTVKLSTPSNRRLVSFKSRTQIIPHEESYILSPSRYLLESQKYYNELFSPRFYAPHLFPVNRASQEQKVANVSTNRTRKLHKTKRLDHRRSSGIKLNPKRININTRSDETFSVFG